MKRLLALAPLLVLLTSCTATPEPAPAVTVTSYVEVPGPTVTVTATAAPEPVASSDEPALIFEALGEGTANVTWSAGGTVVQREATLPFQTPLTPGSYVAGVVQRMSGGGVGCRLTLNGTVVDEKQPQDGQFYAECVLKD